MDRLGSPSASVKLFLPRLAKIEYIRPVTASQHQPVLLAEVLDWLAPRPGQILVDGTLGGAGHTRAIAQRVAPGGQVIALDRDSAALRRAGPLVEQLPVRLIQANFCDLPDVLQSLTIPLVDGIVLDLGLSSDQLADADRGFSFTSEGSLDLRFDASVGEPAWRLINRLNAESLADLIYEFGEERFSRRIARAIVERRRSMPIRTAGELADLIRRVVPRSRGPRRIDPATRTFQALRIAVNDELKSLETALRKFPECLKPGARLAVISFHSLEDRRVKEAFRGDPRYRPLTRKPVVPSDHELAENPRSRSAKLRVAERLSEIETV